MSNFFKQSWLVLVCAALFGLLLAIVYSSFQPLIEANQRAKLQRGIRSILANAETIDADTLTIGSGNDAEEVVVYTGLDLNSERIGYVFKAAGTGFQDKLELLIGVGPRLETFQGIAILFAAETPGFGDAVRDSAIFRCQFVGAPAQDLYVIKAGDRNKTDDAEIVAITGATITSKAVTNIINKRWQTIKPLLKTGS